MYNNACGHVGIGECVLVQRVCVSVYVFAHKDTTPYTQHHTQHHAHNTMAHNTMHTTPYTQHRTQHHTPRSPNPTFRGEGHELVSPKPRIHKGVDKTRGQVVPSRVNTGAMGGSSLYQMHFIHLVLCRCWEIVRVRVCWGMLFFLGGDVYGIE